MQISSKERVDIAYHIATLLTELQYFPIGDIRLFGSCLREYTEVSDDLDIGITIPEWYFLHKGPEILEEILGFLQVSGFPIGTTEGGIHITLCSSCMIGTQDESLYTKIQHGMLLWENSVEL